MVMIIYRLTSMAVLALNCRAAVLTVDPDAGMDEGDCQAVPCNSIKFALSKAAPHDVVTLLSGTYRGEGNRDIEVLTPHLTIASKGSASDCIIDLESLGRGFILGQDAGLVSIENLTVKNGICSDDPDSVAVMGAGFFLDQSRATLRNLIISDMICTFSSPAPPKFSGAALFLRESHALIENVEVRDSFANHGGGAATWGNEGSVFRNVKFLRNGGEFWGGCLLLEENTSTEFHGCLFSHSRCNYGAALDDGTTAHPLFKDCVFEYGEAIHGGVGYHYGNSKTRYDGTIIRHNLASSSGGAMFIVATSLPSYRKVTFYNNSADIHAGAVRSNYDGSKGPLVFDSCSFINNTAKGEQSGAVELHAMDAIFTDCLFENNTAEGSAGAAAINSVARTPLVFERTVFKRNHARDGGALRFFGVLSGEDADYLPSAIFRDCSFQENYAIKGGAIIYEQAGLLIINSTVFLSNAAVDKGGAIVLLPLNGYSPRVQISDSLLVGNEVDGKGGGLYCMQMDAGTTSLIIKNTTIQNSKSYGDGAGMFSGCAHMNFENVIFKGNYALGNGAGLLLASRVKCRSSDLHRSAFSDIEFIENVAGEGGGAVYFDHTSPSCELPIDAGGNWNTTNTSAWSWKDVSAAFSKNIAAYGIIQATAPSSIKLHCGQQSAGCELTLAPNSSEMVLQILGFPGLPISIAASLVDDFAQKISNGLFQVEIHKDEEDERSEDMLLHAVGGNTFLLSQGLANIENAYVLYTGNGTMTTSRIRLMVRIPRSFTALRSTQAALVHFVSASCPAGYIQESHPSVAGAQWCVACEKGQFGQLGDARCIGCHAGTFSNKSGSSACTVCPVGHSCAAGSAAPYQCLAGTFQAQQGQRQCDPCERNYYTSDAGSSNCAACTAGTVTRETRTTSLSGCRCGEQTYESHSGTCVACPDGMVCPWGTRSFVSGNLSHQASFTPRVKAGYWSSPEDPLSVFQCFDADSDTCTGGLPGSCVEGGRSGFMCLSCPSGQVRDGSGCGQCSALNQILIPIGLIVVCCLLIATYYTNNSVLLVNATADLIVAVVFGMAVTMFQVLGMFSYLKVAWSKVDAVEPVQEAGKPFVGGFENMGISCIIGENPSVNFYFLLSMPFVVTIWFLACYCVSHAMLRLGWTARRWEIAKVINSLGFLYTAIFISITSISISPFQLSRHPNQKFSMIRYPDVLYGEGEYWTMGAMALLSFMLFVVPYTAFCIWGMYRAVGHVPHDTKEIYFAGSLSRREIGRTHVMLRFLLYRFRPGCWWWGIPVLVRQLLLAFAPVLPQEEPHAQTLYVSFVLAGYVLVGASVFPWKSDLLNFLDFTLCLGLMMFIAPSTSIMEPSKRVGIYQAIMITAFGVVLLAQVYALCLAVASMVKHGRWAGVEQKILSGGPPKGLAQLWYDVCHMCSRMPFESMQLLIGRMSFYDCSALADAADSWHALAPGLFPARSASKHRLIALEHSACYQDGRTTEQLVREMSTHFRTTNMSGIPSDGVSGIPSDSVQASRTLALTITSTGDFKSTELVANGQHDFLSSIISTSTEIHNSIDEGVLIDL